MSELVGLVRREITIALRRGRPRVADVAKTLELSPRTMQRRLANQGTSFSVELDAVLRERALSGLEGTGVAGKCDSVAELSHALGYKRQASLSRAVRRWTGAPPKTLLLRT